MLKKEQNKIVTEFITVSISGEYSIMEINKEQELPVYSEKPDNTLQKLRKDIESKESDLNSLKEKDNKFKVVLPGITCW